MKFDTDIKLNRRKTTWNFENIRIHNFEILYSKMIKLILIG